MNLIKKFKKFFFKPDTSDHERIERWKNEVDEADRLKELHLKARKEDKKALTVEDFERANQSKRNKNKKLSTNF
tara:strand:+ start:207 stop:428 length:222 start_codon:yes stop_codon:yes gene_type:complete